MPATRDRARTARPRTVPLKQVAPRRYQATVPLWGQGRYHVVAQRAGGERNDQAFGGFIVPYSPEYLRFRSNRRCCNEIAERTGGRVLVGRSRARTKSIERGREPKRSSKPIFDWFLIALAFLMPLDVGDAPRADRLARRSSAVRLRPQERPGDRHDGSAARKPSRRCRPTCDPKRASRAARCYRHATDSPTCETCQQRADPSTLRQPPADAAARRARSSRRRTTERLLATETQEQNEDEVIEWTGI